MGSPTTNGTTSFPSTAPVGALRAATGTVTRNVATCSPRRSQQRAERAGDRGQQRIVDGAVLPVGSLAQRAEIGAGHRQPATGSGAGDQ